MESIKTNLLIISLVTFSFLNNAQVASLELPDVNIESAFLHHKELVGKTREPQSIIANTEASQLASRFILDIVRESLPAKYKKDAVRITAAIVDEANRYNMDPLFLVSVIKQESKFNPAAIGSVGEVGLMQIRPCTAKWLNDKFKIVKKVKLHDPVNNIKIGAFYFDQLRDKFDQNSRWYISAYNMGVTKLKRKIANNEKPKIYVQNVMRHYVKFVSELHTALALSQSTKTMTLAMND
jgi:soluble lytic murein transglycosylase